MQFYWLPSLENQHLQSSLLFHEQAFQAQNLSFDCSSLGEQDTFIFSQIWLRFLTETRHYEHGQRKRLVRRIRRWNNETNAYTPAKMRSSCLHCASRVEVRKVLLPFSAVWCHAMFLSHGSNFFSEEFLVIYAGILSFKMIWKTMNVWLSSSESTYLNTCGERGICYKLSRT